MGWQTHSLLALQAPWSWGRVSVRNMFRSRVHGQASRFLLELGVIIYSSIIFPRKNFDRHFQESRHAFGMRALGLPNTKHFHEITRIEDALSRTYPNLFTMQIYLQCDVHI